MVIDARLKTVSAEFGNLYLVKCTYKLTSEIVISSVCKLTTKALLV